MAGAVQSSDGHTLPAREEGSERSNPKTGVHELHTGVHRIHSRGFSPSVSQGEAGVHPRDVARGIQNLHLRFGQTDCELAVSATTITNLHLHVLLPGGHGERLGRHSPLHPHAVPHLLCRRCIRSLHCQSRAGYGYWPASCLQYLRLLLSLLRTLHSQVLIPHSSLMPHMKNLVNFARFKYVKIFELYFLRCSS